MRKLLIAALAVAVAVSGFSVIATANQGDAGTSWNFTAKPNKVKKPARTSSVIEPSKVDDQGTADRSDDVWTPTAKTTIIFPRGSSVDTGALARCKLTASEVGAGEDCPANTQVGDGEAISVTGGTAVGSNGQRRGGEDTAATIVAYNQKSKILFVVTVCGNGTGPGTGQPCQRVTDIVLEGTWSKVATRPTLVVPTPPGLLSLGIVIRRFELNTDKHTKTVKKNGKEVLKSFNFTPETCDGKWVSKAKAKYVDGTKQTIKDTQKCRKP